MPLWKYGFVAFTVVYLPLHELWNWGILISRAALMNQIYAHNPLPSLLEAELYLSAIAIYGAIVGLRVLRHSPQAYASVFRFLWLYLGTGVITLFSGGFAFPRPSIRADLGEQFLAERAASYFIAFTIYLVVFLTFYILFKRARTREAALHSPAESDALLKQP